MTSRSRHPGDSAGQAVPGTASAELLRSEPGPRPRALLLSAGLVSAGAVALAAGALLPVIQGGSPGFIAAPLLVVLALAPAAAVLYALATGRSGLAAGLVLGLTALAPGRLLLDLQLLADGSLAARPELFLADRLLALPPAGPGLWPLVAGHLLTLAAGAFAAGAARDEAELAGELDGRRRWRLLGPVLGVAGGVGLLLAPFGSGNAYLLAKNAFEGPTVAMAGYLLLAALLPLTALVAVSSPSAEVGKGGFAGAGLAALAVGVPPVIAGLVVDRLSVAPGSVVVTVAGMALVGLAFTRFDVTETREAVTGDMAGEAKLPGLFWWRLATGGLALLAAAAAAAGALAPVLKANGPTPVPETPARWLLLGAAVVLAVPALFVFVPRLSAFARGVVAATWAGVVLAGAAVLSAALSVTEDKAVDPALFGVDLPLPDKVGFSAGPGVTWTFVALVLAAVAALAAVITGVVERDVSDDDDNAELDTGLDGTRAGGNVLTPLVAAAILAIAAFGSPVFTAPGYTAPGLWSDFGAASWGLLGALAVVLGLYALVPRSRPAAAASALAGAALVLGLRAAELPLVGSEYDGSSAGIGFWLALGGAAVTLVTAGMAVAGARRAG
ncbi:hypothetical protein SAMN04489729_4035 [Amycolatopsis lurida]|uniref:Uncharacterized protein n=1 Tax=Amycolatopsis lurida NRRL 2430 TaxID=1460371 RepID=A0A2P2G2B6_AMYLU|nr:hypothetical protein [Amycolatopsis lurida]KFU83120.1 hypothetical protein BB31_01110 [Amycolatopsis lurida NRRL 2430]SED32415.1 hypothetical protein SAMN04489729_4035 [Amycolatopsis lurida]